MRRKFLGIGWALLVAMPLLLLSCGDDNGNGGTGPENGGEETAPPDLAQIETPQTIDFQSEDQTATFAQAMVQSQLALTQALTAAGGGYMAALQGANWGDESSGCWSWSFTDESCTVTYTACETAEGFEWVFTVNGNCDGEVFTNWVAGRGTTNADGTEGTFRWFEEQTTNTVGVWTWVVATDRMSGTWYFYEGDLASENLRATLEWTKNADGSVDMTWTFIGEGKTEFHIDADGLSGWMKSYELDEATQTFIMTAWISWDHGTGFWRMYEDGVLVNEQLW